MASIPEGTPPESAALRTELSSLKPRALKKRAAEVGVDEDKIDEADDADDVKATLVDLILKQEAENAKSSQAQALRDELETLKPRALKNRARELGVDKEKLDEADDADDVKATIIALIIEKATNDPTRQQAAAALAEDLESLKPRALKKRAAEAGVDEDKIDEADDADDVKAALIALVMEKAGFSDSETVAKDRDTPVSAHYGTANVAVAQAGLFGDKHAILSYQWDAQALVVAARDMLNKKGIPTWMDIGASNLLKVWQKSSYDVHLIAHTGGAGCPQTVACKPTSTTPWPRESVTLPVSSHS
eukprot:COSAG02_NODE_233_length_27847_cov_20.383055_23_plen_304_part_00